jgi:hypothetical protein
VVGGIEGVKAELQRIARRHPRGQHRARARWGCCSPGRWARARPFVAEAVRQGVGLTAIKLKNFRSKWVGATEGNLERILQVVQAIGQVLVIIDEGDRAFGNQSDGDGDGGTSSRVIARIKEFMSGHRQPRADPLHPHDQPARQARPRHQARRPPRQEDPPPLRADR